MTLCLQGVPGIKGDRGEPGQNGHGGSPVSPWPHMALTCVVWIEWALSRGKLGWGTRIVWP